MTVLTDWGVLQERDGDLARWAEDERAQSLLDVDEERLSLVLTGQPGGAALPTLYPIGVTDTRPVAR